MSLDIATLGLELDSSSVKRGMVDLTAIESTGGRVADSLDRAGAKGTAGLSKIGASAATSALEIHRMQQAASDAAELASLAFNQLSERMDAVRASVVADGTELTRMRDKARDLQNQLQEALRGGEVAGLIEKYRALTSAISDTSAKAQLAQESARSAAADLISGGAPKTAQTDYKALVADAKSYEAALQRQQQELAGLSEKLKAAGVDTGNLAKEQETYRNAAAYLAPLKVSYQETIDRARALEAQVARGDATLARLGGRAQETAASVGLLKAKQAELGEEFQRVAALEASASAQSKANALMAAAANEEQRRQAEAAAKAQQDLYLAQTRPLNRVNSAMGVLGIQSDKDIATEVARIEGALSRLKNTAGVSLGEIERGSIAAKARISELRGETDQSSFSFRNAANGIQAVVFALSAIGLTRAIREVTSISDAYAGVTGRLRLVTVSTDDLRSKQEQLFNIAQQTGTSYESVAGLYTKVARNADTLGLSQKDLYDLTTLTNKAIQVGGATTTEASAGVQQFSQALASGQLRGDEFRSVMENMPRLANAISAGLGITIGKLRDMANNGQLTAEVVTKALLSQKDVIDSEFAQLPVTVGRSMTELENSVKRAIASADIQPLVKSIHDLTATVNDPDIVKGITEIAGSLITLANWLAIAAAGAGTLADKLAGMIADGLHGEIKTLTQEYAELALKARIDDKSISFLRLPAIKEQIVETRQQLELLRGAAAQEIVGGVTAFLPKLEQGKDIIPFISGQTQAYIDSLKKGPPAAAAATHANIALAESIAAVTIKQAENTRQLQEAQAAFDYSSNLTGINEYYDQLVSIQKEAYSKTAAARAIELASVNAEVDRMKKLGATDKDSQSQLDSLIAKAEKIKGDIQDDSASNTKALTDLDFKRTDALNAVYSALNPLAVAQEEYDKKLADAKVIYGDSADHAAQLADYQKQLKVALDATAESIDAQLHPGQALITQLQQENAEMAKGLSLQQAQQAIQLRKQNAGDVEIQRARDLQHQQQIMQELFGDQSDPTAALKNGLDDLKNTVTDLSDTYGKFTQLAVSGLDNLVKASEYAAQATRLVGEAQEKASRKAVQTQLGGFGELTAGIAGYFGEGTKGYKALNAASQVFHAAELAIEIATVAQKLGLIGGVTTARILSDKAASDSALASVPIVVGAEGAKAEAAGVTAVAVAAQSSPWTGFATAAAMAAMLAGLGIAIGGVGGGSDSFTKPNTGIGAGKGTVLGDTDATSKSILNSIDRLVSLQDKGLYVANAQLAALRAIQNGITNVGSLLYRQNVATGGATPFAIRSATTYSGVGTTLSNAYNQFESFNPVSAINSKIPVIGDFQGLLSSAVNKLIGGFFGSTKTQQVDSGLILQASQSLGDILANGLDATYYATIKTTTKKYFGLSKSTSYKDITAPISDSLSQQFNLIFQNLASSVLQSTSSLGLGDLSSQLSGIKLDIGKISLEGLTPQEVQDKINAVFSAAADTMVSAIAPGLSEFQQVGEGMYETLVRISAETAAVTQSLGSMGSAFSSLQGLDLARAADNIVQLSGGLDQFTSNVSGYLQNFYSDSERAALQQNQLNQYLSQFGVSLPSTSEGFRGLVDSLLDVNSGLNVTTEAGQETYAALMTIQDAAYQVYQASQAAAQAQQDAFNSFVDGFYTPAQKLQLEGDRLTASLNALGQKLPSSRTGFAALVTGIDRTTAAGEALYQNLLALSDQANQYYSDATSTAQAAQQASSAAKSAADSWNQITKSLNDFADSLLQKLMPATETATSGLQSQFDALIARAKAGDTAAINQLPTVGNALATQLENTSATRTAYELALAAMRSEVLMIADAPSQASLASRSVPAISAPASTGTPRSESASTSSEDRKTRQDIAALRTEMRAVAIHSARTAQLLERVMPQGDALSVRTAA